MCRARRRKSLVTATASNRSSVTFSRPTRMWRALALLLSFSSLAYADDLRVDYVRESLSGTHVHYQQYIDGIRVVGGERVESVFRDGHRQVTDRLAARRGAPRP